MLSCRGVFQSTPFPCTICRVLVWLQLGQDTTRLSSFSLEKKDWTGTSAALGRAVPLQDPAITEGKTVWDWGTCEIFQWKPGHWLTQWKYSYLSLIPGCGQRSELCSYQSICLKAHGPSEARTCLVLLVARVVYLSYSGVGGYGNLVLGISVLCFFETPLVSLFELLQM